MPAILILGVITSYEDIRFGKIRNKWIIFALICSFITYAALIGFYLSKGGIRSEYLIELGTNFLFSIVVGFGLWYMNVWTAGDGKLFIAFCALIPLSVYSWGYQKWIPSFTLLTNIFIPALLIMIVFMLFKAKMKDVKKVSIGFLNEFFKLKQLINSIMVLFAIYWVTQILLSLIGLGNNYLLNIVLTMILMSIAQKKLKNKVLYFMLAISLIRLIIDKSIYTSSFLINFLILLFIWKFIRSFLQGSLSKLGQEIFAAKIDTDILKPGMVLSETIEKKGKITKEELGILKKQMNIKIIEHKGDCYILKPKSDMNLDNFLEEEAEGLTKEQINKTKTLGIKKIKVSQTVPFAPFMFMGVILTIIIKGNILILIKTLF